jgi:hypothetical protein
MIHLPYLSVAHFSGPDTGAFLQAQLSADIAALTDGQSTFAAYCSPRGQVFGLLLVGRQAEGYFLVGSAQLLPSILQRLRIYVLRAKVEIEHLDEVKVCGLTATGPGGPAGVLLAPESVPLQYAVVSENTVSGPAGEDWRIAELSHGVAWLDSNTTEKFIPQMLNYDQIGAVSFSKGCYPGQEIVARAHYLGKVKRKALVLKVEGHSNMENGSKLQVQYEEAATSATLIDSAPAGRESTLLLIITREEKEKKPVSIDHEDQSYPVMIM